MFCAGFGNLVVLLMLLLSGERVKGLSSSHGVESSSTTRSDRENKGIFDNTAFHRSCTMRQATLDLLLLDRIHELSFEKHSFQLSGLMHSENDIAAAHKLPLDIKLRNRRPRAA